jgi:hypothetical protein
MGDLPDKQAKQANWLMMSMVLIVKRWNGND